MFKKTLAFSLIGVVGGALLLALPAQKTLPVLTHHAEAAEPPRECAWPYLADSTTLNIAYPDASAKYWIMPYQLATGAKLVISGAYPGARFFNFTTYNLENDPLDHITDFAIQANTGSVNPFSTPNTSNDPAQCKCSYTVTVKGNNPDDPTPNQVAAANGGSGTLSGKLIYRLYVPNKSDQPTGGVPLPSIKLVDAGGKETALRTCVQTVAPKHPLGEPTASPSDTTVTFIRNSVGGLYPNKDNAYLTAMTKWAPRRIVVVRAQAPTFPNTRRGDYVTKPSNLRFWSMCSNEYRNPYPVTQCAADYDTVVDPSGSYTYVVSAAEDKPRNLAAANATWLPWNKEANGMLILRNMLPASGFSKAAQYVVPTGATGDEQMGPYAPVAAYCTTETFEAGSVGACLAGAANRKRGRGPR